MLSGALHMWPGTQHYRFAAGVACMGHPDHGRMTLKGYTGGRGGEGRYKSWHKSFDNFPPLQYFPI